MSKEKLSNPNLAFGGEDVDIASKIVQKQYIIERVGKYLMKYDLYDLLDLYIEIKSSSEK